ncbi:transposase [Bradyrhizobium sp. F1.4.3]
MGRHESKNKGRDTISVVHPNAAAIGIGATMHMAAVNADRTPEPVRSLGTFTTDLHRLVDWFAECGVDTVVMESTSVYWILIFELLDARGFAVRPVNARDAKHVPGRKTDVSDAQWQQRLHSFGLLRSSFWPKGQITELCAYLRQRERLLKYGASHIQHMQKRRLNERAAPSRRHRYSRCDRTADHPRDPHRQAQSGSTGAHAGSALPRQCRDISRSTRRELPR